MLTPLYPTPQSTPFPSSQPTQLPTRRPTPSPTPRPTPLSTPRPTPLPTPQPTPRAAKLEAILAPHQPLHQEALAWLLFEDTWEPDDGVSNSEALWLERYAMAIFTHEFYAGYDGPTSAPIFENWLSSDSVSNWGPSNPSYRSSTPECDNLGFVTSLTLSKSFLLARPVLKEEKRKDLCLSSVHSSDASLGNRRPIPTEIGLLSQLTLLNLGMYIEK